MTTMWQTIDAYCERTSAALWAEPANAITNLAFIAAAWVMWRRSAGLPVARALCGVLAVIGVGSGLFHTFANGLTAGLDVAPILVFILIYVFAASRDFLWLTGWRLWAMVLGVVPYAAIMVPLFGRIEALGSSAAYGPVPVLILGFAAALWGRARATAMGMMVGVVILIVSLALRTLDLPLCGSVPMGTHFLWHLLNAVMLGWMIEVYCRHMRVTRGTEA
jgi:hypothetical protein